jgi:predicted RNA binding protein YcfA (HicA-like mRNA interferase family)
MTPLPVISGKKEAKAFQRAGYEFSHQTGSHMILRSSEPPHRHLSIPDHRELRKGLLRGLIRDAGLTVEEFIELL